MVSLETLDLRFQVSTSLFEIFRGIVEFILNGLYASDRISRVQKHGRITYEV